MPPPDQEGERRGQRAGHSLAQQGAAEEHEGEDIQHPAAPARSVTYGVEVQIDRRRREIEHATQNILAFRDPGHRLSLHRMDCEQHRGKPGGAERTGRGRAGERRQPNQDAPQQQGAGGVQQHVHEVVTDRVQTPQVVLEPEARVHQRIVLRAA